MSQSNTLESHFMFHVHESTGGSNIWKQLSNVPVKAKKKDSSSNIIVRDVQSKVCLYNKQRGSVFYCYTILKPKEPVTVAAIVQPKSEQ